MPGLAGQKSAVFLWFETVFAGVQVARGQSAFTHFYFMAVMA